MNINLIKFNIAALLMAGAATTLLAVNDDAPMTPSLTGDAGMMNIGTLIPDESMMQGVSLVDSDSLKRAAIDNTVQKAADLYKHLKWQKYENQPEKEIFATAFDCYSTCLDAMRLAPKGSPKWEQCKSMLRDINKDLEAGAFFYSGMGDQAMLTQFAQAFVDTHMMDAFKGEDFPRNSAYPAIVYIAASGAYNAKDYNKAIDYFDRYLSTGDEKSREQIYLFLGQACINTGKYEQAVKSMGEAIALYPDNYNLMLIAIQGCIDGGHSELLQPFLDKALFQKPFDEQLLNIQGKLYEDQQAYQKALDVYRKLEELRPDNLGVARHIALCYYNLGVDFYNKAIYEEDEKIAKKNSRQSDTYFDAAAMKLEEVVANDPTSIKYLKALAVSYGCLGNKDKFEAVNTRIRALGDSPVADKSMPGLITANDGDVPNFTGSGKNAKDMIKSNAPLYSDFAKSYVEKHLNEWAKKGEFEKNDDYTKRVNEVSLRQEYERLSRKAQDEYLTAYGKKLRLTDFSLEPYDADNETYLIKSTYGPIYINVPAENSEAETFKSNWKGVHFKNPKYYIENNEVRISSITFVTPHGKEYAYNKTDGIEYYIPPVDLAGISITPASSGSSAIAAAPTTSAKPSDVDENIPYNNKPANSTFAVIIANESYTNVPRVEAALNDGETFSKYCNLTLGIPKENIRIYKDATLGKMLRAIADIRNVVNSVDGNADVVFYYAGHGMPDEGTKDAFLLPVDGDAMVSESCISLARLYSDLADMGARSVMVFLDACFSGGNRSGGMLTAARGVAIKAKETAPKGNMFTLSAASGQETAMPYKEKNHGLFTYYVLKKLQETKGNVTLKELSDYVIDNVRRQSTIVNKKPQTPQVSTSGKMAEEWTKRKMRN